MQQNNEVEGVQFETDSYKAVKFSDGTDAPKIVRLVMKYSGLEDEKQANYVIFGFVVLAIVVSFFLFFKTGGGSTMTLPAGAKIIYPPNEPPRLAEPVTSYR